MKPPGYPTPDKSSTGTSIIIIISWSGSHSRIVIISFPCRGWIFFASSCFACCPFGFFVLACVLSPSLGVCVYLLLPLVLVLLLFLLFYARTICILII